MTAQLNRWRELQPREGTRHTPVAGVLLTDSELDHALGLLHLREGQQLVIYCTQAVAEALENDLQILPALSFYAEVRLELVEVGNPVTLGGAGCGLNVEWFETGRDLPRYSASRAAAGAVTGLEIEDVASGARVLYVPGAGEISEDLSRRLNRADVIFFDGTFWTEDEFPSIGGGTRSAKDMGHLPITGSSGSLRRLANCPARIKRYIHINNTNPILDPSSPQRKELREAGLEVAEDGEEVKI